jgi:hypothetical protein
LPQCYAGFEISPTCISERGLDQKKEEYQRKMAEAMSRLGASYKITLRLVNDPVAAGYDVTAADVFTDVVRDQGGRAGRIRNTSCGRAIGFDYSFARSFVAHGFPTTWVVFRHGDCGVCRHCA